MSFAIGLSGLQAATRRLDAAAFDVARASAQRLGAPPAGQDGTAPPGGALAGGAPPADTAGGPAPPGAATGAAAPEVDLPRAMVESISASAAFLANLQTIRRSDEAAKALLDVRR
jgi:flagellar basal body rod protein FlgC